MLFLSLPAFIRNGEKGQGKDQSEKFAQHKHKLKHKRRRDRQPFELHRSPGINKPSDFINTTVRMRIVANVWHV